MANSLMFLIHLHETQDMDREKLDDILKKGDELYCQTRQNLEARKMFVCKHLNFDDIPNIVTSGEKHHIILKDSPMSGYLLQDAPQGLENYLNLSQRLGQLGSVFSRALLIVGAVCISVYQDSNGLYGFYPHSRNANGSAVMVTFQEVIDLANRLLLLFCTSLELEADQQYDLLPVSFQTLTDEDHTLEVNASIDWYQNPEL